MDDRRTDGLAPRLLRRAAGWRGFWRSPAASPSRSCADAGGRRFPPLQQHRQPGRHRARLQGQRGLDHRRLVEPVGAQLRDLAARARWSRATITSMRSTTTAAANGPGKAFMCTRDKEFTIRGIEDCLARGYDRTGFFEVDTGEQRSWTVQLTESGRAGAAAAAAIARPAGAAARRLPAGRPAPPHLPKQELMRRLRRTKIVATLGPASSRPQR